MIYTEKNDSCNSFNEINL